MHTNLDSEMWNQIKWVLYYNIIFMRVPFEHGTLTMYSIAVSGIKSINKWSRAELIQWSRGNGTIIMQKNRSYIVKNK